jgi:hypothetical protein
VQGRLRKEPLTIVISSTCAQSGQPVHIKIDSDLRYSVEEELANPLVFEPEVDWQDFTEPNIINTY